MSIKAVGDSRNVLETDSRRPDFLGALSKRARATRFGGEAKQAPVVQHTRCETDES